MSDGTAPAADVVCVAVVDEDEDDGTLKARRSVFIREVRSAVRSPETAHSNSAAKAATMSEARPISYIASSSSLA